MSPSKSARNWSPSDSRDRSRTGSSRYDSRRRREYTVSPAPPRGAAAAPNEAPAWMRGLEEMRETGDKVARLEQSLQQEASDLRTAWQAQEVNIGALSSRMAEAERSQMGVITQAVQTTASAAVDSKVEAMRANFAELARWCQPTLQVQRNLARLR
ncbi:unnamed protein product [Prorocentrum cordatum]|uniref:Biogenesis of lysosome-related organelles complex 1 subunit 1 n=1 Tax=Prorocentrum cordatum TaxID=2364126 RepID=A0ABN9T9G6_9DINO|nr:unnamed protein product [Polarella glacialis]